jgi:alpha-1,2-mannosyltransferase
VSVVASLVAFRFLAEPHNSFDLRIYRGSVDWWVSHGDLYGFELGERRFGFTYPPFAAVCMLPMLLLPLDALVLLNAAVILASAVFVVRTFVARLPSFDGTSAWWTAAIITPPLFLLQPLRDTLTFGQINIELAALVVADMLLLDRRSRWAGVGAGLATALKLTPGLFVVFYLVAGAPRAARTAGLTFAAATGAVALAAPGTSRTFWTSTIFDSGRVGSYDSATNQSLSGVLARLANDVDVPRAWVPLVAVLAVYALWSARRLLTDGALLSAFTVVGLAAALVSPISWVHHLWWVAPGLLVLLDRGVRRRSSTDLLAVGVIALIFVSGMPDRLRASPGHHLDSLGTVVGENAYTAALLVLLVLLSRRSGPLPRASAAGSLDALELSDRDAQQQGSDRGDEAELEPRRDDPAVPGDRRVQPGRHGGRDVEVVEDRRPDRVHGVRERVDPYRDRQPPREPRQGVERSGQEGQRQEEHLHEPHDGLDLLDPGDDGEPERRQRE